MDSKTISELGCLLDDSINQRSTRVDTKKRLKKIIHNKSVNTLIQELTNYLSSLSGKKKTTNTLIVVMALLHRNLDCAAELATAIEKANLTNNLYGDLFILFTGNSSKLSLSTELHDNYYPNKLEFVECFSVETYFNAIEIYEACRVLELIDHEKFEQVAMTDKTKLLLLNMASYSLTINPSDELVRALICDRDELKQNIGFFFISRRISKYLSDIEYIKRQMKMDIDNKNIKNNENGIKLACEELTAETNRCLLLLKDADKQTQASLLLNFLLLHKVIYPTSFTLALLSDKLQEEFAAQMLNTDKIRNIKDLTVLLEMISRTPALNEDKKRIPKTQLYAVVADIIIGFINERKGIYLWDGAAEYNIKIICERLPKRYLVKIKTALAKMDKTLMYGTIDKLVRFNIYLEDKKKHELITNIINVIDENI